MLKIGKHKGIDMNIDINGNLCMPYQRIKLLGVNIDCQFTFREHISEISRKSSQMIGVIIIMKLCNLILTTAKLQL